MFMGEYNHTIDAKGRLIIPSKFRELLGEEFVLTKGLDGCLSIYPMDEWEAFEEKLRALPLTNKKKIAVVGPMAKNGWDLLGSWCGHGKHTDVEMIYDGLTAEFGGDAELRYAMGCKPQGNDRSGFAGALDVARWSDVVIVCLGEMLTWSVENASRSTIDLPQIE